ncbi:hypothetical protein FVEN_g8816 [Fusarium venenatum]|uniref:Uncharacterized protein n=1 Tax=Fusarium venenatum TaxID=56646 RepID=A0A2L2TXQ7_9HYPO|nr:uncharacterized protein FVRRES_02067 [Fusarium venenatum]KAG8353191.1 hypothetical protein FVEN_g8816 [Fusarium venenatum]KAH7004801.1 hypothetical protein EDB82DRAFT_520809 [Fusarium venenatum]CEI65555.1 unnamed protein product [Fusarium venenatum]
MFNHHQDKNSTTQISSSEITPTQPRQEGKLALLPTEILLQILNETEVTEKTPPQSPTNSEFEEIQILAESPTHSHFAELKTPEKVAVCMNILSARDMRNLALASSSFFYRVCPSFYLANNCYAFRSALEHTDLDAMKRCAKFGAAPDTHWDLEKECKCKGHKGHLVHLPIDCLLESVKNGSVPISKSIEALQWLLDNGYSAFEQTPHLKKNLELPGGGLGLERQSEAELSAQLKTLSMPEILILTLDKSTGDRDRTEGICEMIDMLLHHGYLIPYNLNVYETHRGSDSDDIYTPMNAAMKPQCPPRFLGVLLELYKRHDGHNQRRGDDGHNRTLNGCPESMASWVGWSLVDEQSFHFVHRKWKHRPNLGALARNLFLAVLDTTQDWKEAYNGEIADIFEEKIKLLEKYNFIDDTETQALQGILEALQCIAAMAESLGGLDRARDGKKCWQLICDPLRLVFYDLVDDYDSPPRVHHFEFEYSWHPWIMFYEEEYLQQRDISAEQYPYPWIKKGSLWKQKDGKVIDENFISMTRGLRWWYEFDYDAFLERISQKWIQSEKELEESQARKRQQQEATEA